MRKLSFPLYLVAVGAIAAVAGCSSGGGGGGTGGSGGSSANGIPLVPSGDGFFDGTNAAGVLGAWYSYGDDYNPTPGTGDCPTKGKFPDSACSSITTPTPGQPFTNTGGNMCTAGTVAVVMNMDYSNIWGAGIGFDLNNPGVGDAGAGTTSAKGDWDATKYGVTGFSFTLSDFSGMGTVPIGGHMRVELPASTQSGTDAAYWGGASMDLSPMMQAGNYSFKFADVGGPKYATNPPAFDPKHIQSMQFHVVSNTASTIPYGFCISNLVALTN